MSKEVNRESIDLFKVTVQTEIEGLKNTIKSLGDQIKYQIDQVNQRIEEAEHNPNALFMINGSGELQTMPHSYDIAVSRLAEAKRLLDEYDNTVKYRNIIK